MSSFESVRRDYTRHLEKERNLSIHTIRAYMGDLDSFFEHVALQKVLTVDEITIAHIRSWLANNQVKGGARTTLSRRATSIRLFVPTNRTWPPLATVSLTNAYAESISASDCWMSMM